MSTTKKRILAIIICLITIFGWYVTIFGIGSVDSIKDKFKLGLDIEGGVYVVMEAQTDAKGAKLRDDVQKTLEAMAEAKRISADKSVKGYESMEELKAALESDV